MEQAPFSPLVSIIIPVYNGSKYLKEAIESAIAQTYENIEIIVVNDGSNDNGRTERIIKRYRERIRSFSKENGGVATALNLAIRNMKGGYFSWLSHDDLYEPGKIATQIEFLRSLDDKNVILYSNYSLIDSKSKPIGEVVHNHKMLTEKPEYALYRGCINGISLLIPSIAFQDCGLFNEGLRCTQDYDLWLDMMDRYQFIHLQDVLVKTRLHTTQDSKSSVATDEGNVLWIKMVEKMPLKKKKELEGSEYAFYKEMSNFLEKTPYKKAAMHCMDKCANIEKREITGIEKILVTVIVPFFNRIDELLISLGTALNQTHKNLEILLVNDCSTESLVEIKRIMASDKRIRLIDLEKNGGPARARNVGIENANGEYIAFLDSDDYWVEGKVGVQLKKMKLYESVFSHTSYIRNGREGKQFNHSGLFEGFIGPELIVDCPIATPTVMIKTNFLRNNGYRFPEIFTVGEDVCFWLELLRECRVCGIDEGLTIVNVNEVSAATNREKQIKGLKNIITYILNHPYYRQFDNLIASLCRVYCAQVKNNRIIEPVEHKKRKKKLVRIVKKLFNSIKNEGLIGTTRRIVRKGIKKIHRKELVGN
jgi:glycosyltransferase involved in cell wall biosynthesis